MYDLYESYENFDINANVEEYFGINKTGLAENFINNSIIYTSKKGKKDTKFKILVNLVKENNWIEFEKLLNNQDYRDLIYKVDSFLIRNPQLSGKTRHDIIT